jgi:hypothetical protein
MITVIQTVEMLNANSIIIVAGAKLLLDIAMGFAYQEKVVTL